jgi:hypothetical protein
MPYIKIFMNFCEEREGNFIRLIPPIKAVNVCAEVKAASKSSRIPSSLAFSR